MSTAIVSAVIAGVFSVISALIARSAGPRQSPAVMEGGHAVAAAAGWSSARWLSWVAAVAWIIPLFGFPFSLVALGFAVRDSRPAVQRRVPGYVVPVAVIALVLTILNAIWGGYQAAHGCQFYQPSAGCHQ